MLIDWWYVIENWPWNHVKQGKHWPNYNNQQKYQLVLWEEAVIYKQTQGRKKVTVFSLQLRQSQDIQIFLKFQTLLHLIFTS